MDKFERLNRETWLQNNTKSSFYTSTKQEQSGNSKAYWDYLNRQTYKQNNGQYPSHY